MKRRQEMKREIKTKAGCGIAAMLVGGMVFLSACGSSPEFDRTMASGSSYDTSASSYEGAYAYDEAEEETAYDDDVEDFASDETEGNMEELPDTSSAAVDQEMLVYHCDLSIDTLDFEQSLTAFKQALAGVGGFVENEEFADGGGYGGYYVDRAEKTYTYHATVRVPSAKYEFFLNQTEGLGDVRSRSSYTDNVATEYGTAKATLEIYEAEYDRYLAQLEKTEDDNVALKLQRELTELMVKIAELKTRMSMIESDVAYSYINITIRGVERYEAPAGTSTFGERLRDTWYASWTGFCGFLEGLLFFFIYTWWYLVIIAVIVVVVVVLIKRHEKKRRERLAAQQPYFPGMAAPQEQTPPKAPRQEEELKQ